jgi:hypothetical protein
VPGDPPARPGHGHLRRPAPQAAPGLTTRKVNELQAEAAAQRLAKKARSARGESRGRLAAALSTVRSFASFDASPVVPKLTDYPSRS